ncbi:uncharacterized protein BXIN_0898 [Babesia sp. Xinjiang]|uniref:uncharacterized protein n=1 Tax=Babesia sp. Xinjiang TaxID=462227 RepID=UPI000A2371C0|nr:uncharacterized protein BXIN_0898 [Babesia sp. Xinjiang]ORM41246.1 hypothetical protein BXIN_0898 [Babesia sp. Xinjiang]
MAGFKLYKAILAFLAVVNLMGCGALGTDLPQEVDPTNGVSADYVTNDVETKSEVDGDTSEDDDESDEESESDEEDDGDEGDESVDASESDVVANGDGQPQNAEPSTGTSTGSSAHNPGHVPGGLAGDCDEVCESGQRRFQLILDHIADYTPKSTSLLSFKDVVSGLKGRSDIRVPADIAKELANIQGYSVYYSLARKIARYIGSMLFNGKYNDIPAAGEGKGRMRVTNNGMVAYILEALGMCCRLRAL